MNKKILLLGGIIVVILSLSFYFLLPRSSQLNNLASSQKQNDSSNSNATDLFAQAFIGGDSVKCTFTQDGKESASYIKKGKIRFDSQGVDGAAYGNAIVNGNLVYVWQTGNNEGIMIDTSKAQGASSAVGQQYMDAEKIKTEVEKNQPTCVKENIDDSIFTPPATVTFTDYSSMMQKVQPSGAMTQEQIENLMQQYQQ